MSHRCAVALFAECIAVGAAAIFCRAAIRPGGYRVSIAPCASARNSRFRETARLMISPAIGAITISDEPDARR